MFRDSDLNMFFTWCVNSKMDIRKTKDKYRDILEIINTNMEIKKGDMPINILNRVKCLKTLIELHLDNKSIENAISEISNINKWQEDSEYIKLKYDEEIKEDVLNEIIKTIEMHSKLAVIRKQTGDIEKLSDILNNGDYDTVEDAYKIIEDINVNVGNAIKKVERNRMTESRIILGKDDLKKTIEKRMKKYDRSNKIPTGFEYIDDNILKGGFERNRLYIFGGSSASGKSTILVNMALNAALHKNYVGELKTKRKIFIYITLENDKEESWSRIMCSYFNISDIELSRKLTENSKDIEDIFTKDIESNNSYISLHQFNTQSISSTNVGVLIDELVEEHGGEDKCMVAAVYLDYLELLGSDIKSKDKGKYVELADITQEMKNLAIDFEIPVITATQLNRESFKVNNSYELSNTLVADSIGKVFIADFFALLAKNNYDDSLVHFRVGKFRSGNPDVPLDFKVNFEHFKFLDCNRSKNPKEKKGKEVEGGVLMIDNDGSNKSKPTIMDFPGCEI